MNVTVLVDFDNDSRARPRSRCAEALGDDLWGVRLDTSDRLADVDAAAPPRRRRRRRGVAAELVAAACATRSTRRPRARADRRLRRLHTPSASARFEAARRARSTPTASARR